MIACENEFCSDSKTQDIVFGNCYNCHHHQQDRTPLRRTRKLVENTRIQDLVVSKA